MSTRGLIAAMSIEEPTDTDIFLAYLDHVLCPKLRSGDVVVMDNLSAHKAQGVRERIAAAGAELLYLPPYSPDLNPIRRLTPNGWHSIFSVMRDGEDLAQKLRPISELDNPELQVDLLSRVIRPYIQTVDPDAVCAHTGLKLNDIWRYFRHTWVTSYKSVPGRLMMILIRDAAAPNHPVIGIASLASSVVQQQKRDEWIGWDGDAVVEKFAAVSKPKQHARWLISELDEFIKGLYLRGPQHGDRSGLLRPWPE